MSPRAFCIKKETFHEVLQQSGFQLAKIGLESGSTSSYLTKKLKALRYDVTCIEIKSLDTMINPNIPFGERFF